MKYPSIQNANSRTIICLSIGTIAMVVARQGTMAMAAAGLQAGNDGDCRQGTEASAIRLGGGLRPASAMDGPVAGVRNGRARGRHPQ